MSRGNTRASKIASQAVKPGNKEKFKQEQRFIAMPFKPDGAAQTLGAKYLREGKKIVVLQGPAGGGKSILAAWHAANLLKQDKIKKVYLVRPYEPCGRSIGAVPGTEAEKLRVIFTSILGHLEKFLGATDLKYHLDKGNIEFKSVEWMRGYSFENGDFVLVEEAQGFDSKLMEMITTRVGTGAQMVLTGDVRQKDIRQDAGLVFLKKRVEDILEDAPDWMDDEDLDQLEEHIGFVDFTFEDSGKRDKLTKALVKLYYYEDDNVKKK